MWLLVIELLEEQSVLVLYSPQNLYKHKGGGVRILLACECHVKTNSSNKHYTNRDREDWVVHQLLLRT